MTPAVHVGVESPEHHAPGLDVERFVRVLRAGRFPFMPEAVLQDGIASTLAAAGITFEREFALSRQDRIDFFVPEIGLGVEVKVDGAISSVTRQLHRYAQHERIRGLLLVTTRMRHHVLVPREFCGKRIEVLHLIGASL